MSPEEILEGDIKEYCIACLTKSPDMHNLNEQEIKRTMFTTVFSIELDNYGALPQFLCFGCDIKLRATYNFQEAVRKCLAVLHEYNKKLLVNPIEEVKKEITEEQYNESNIVDKSISEEKAVQLEEIGNQRVAGIKIVSPEEVDRVVGEFKKQHSQIKTCLLCGFIAANRRAISTHMALFHKDRKNNWCPECNDIFEDYEEHKQTHSGKYSCPFCDKEFKASHYVVHLQSHSGTFTCTVCKKTFQSASWLKKHNHIHTNNKPFSCPNCSKCFIQLSSLRYHVGTHGKFPCDSCKKRYKTMEELEEHECVAVEKLPSANVVWIKTDSGLEDHNEEIEETIIIKGSELVCSTDVQNFCKQCNKRVKSLTQHFKKYHTVPPVQETPKVKELRCSFCQISFGNSYKLRLHVRSHTGEYPYKCRYCDKRIINRFRLEEHERTHTKEKPYICNVCGKGLSRDSVLRTHMKQHTGRPEVCQLCNKRFCRKSELKLHLSKHMGEKPFLCTECGKTFAQRSHLTEHMVGHGEERPFQCPYCEKAFKRNILLKEHIKIHYGHKNFQCPSCPYACYKSYRLKQHMKQHSTESNGNQELFVNSLNLETNLS